MTPTTTRPSTARTTAAAVTTAAQVVCPDTVGPPRVIKRVASVEEVLRFFQTAKLLLPLARIPRGLR